MITGYAEQIEDLRGLEEEIMRCIGENGEVVDAASPELASIRSSIRTLEARVREKLDQMVKNPSIQKKLQDPIVTIRGDRFVIPVKQEYRAHFGGIVHDQSALRSDLVHRTGGRCAAE